MLKFHFVVYFVRRGIPRCCIVFSLHGLFFEDYDRLYEPMFEERAQRAPVSPWTCSFERSEHRCPLGLVLSLSLRVSAVSTDVFKSDFEKAPFAFFEHRGS
jgi:hypothetical protein